LGGNFYASLATTEQQKYGDDANENKKKFALMSFQKVSDTQ